MKNLLIGLLILGSFSAFAQDSEFERGFEAGKETCVETVPAKESWLCTVNIPETVCGIGGEAMGRSKAEALNKLHGVCITRALAVKNPIDCKDLLSLSLRLKD